MSVLHCQTSLTNLIDCVQDVQRSAGLDVSRHADRGGSEGRVGL